MFRFFLFMVSVMAASAGMAGEVSPCPGDTVPIQIMIPGYGDSGIKRSAAEVSDIPHFSAFVKAVTEHVAARLSKEKLCITGAKDTENMRSADQEHRSLLQFVHWRYNMLHDYTVPALSSIGVRNHSSSCLISSPWIDIIVNREPVPSIRAIVYWNERQLLADQAVLAGVRNVTPGRAMPLNPSEFGHFMGEYDDMMRYSNYKSMERKSGKKPFEARVPPDILWLFRRSMYGVIPFVAHVSAAMRKTTEKGAEGYTKVVLALIDRCFASSNKREDLHYSSILDVADPVLRKQYKIDTPASR